MRRAWFVLSGFGFLGLLGLVAMLQYCFGAALSAAAVAQVVLAGTMVTSLVAFFGLRWAAVANLPVPFREAVRKGGFAPALGGGLLAAVAAIALLRVAQLPNLPGPLWARAASTLFAMGPLEIFLHLFAMSGLVRLTRRPWIGIAGAAALYVLFHGGGLGSLSPLLTVAVLVINGGFGIYLGWLYKRHGFEHVMLAHAVAHLLAVLFG